MLNNFLISNPLEQFEIRDLLIFDAPILGNLHISVTNIVLYLLISFVIIIIIIAGVIMYTPEEKEIEIDKQR